jgi:hypothetical protein
MKLLQVLSTTLVGSLAVLAFSANAQATVPVSCSWELVGVTGGGMGGYFHYQCRESSGNIAARRTIYNVEHPYMGSFSMCSNFSVSSGVFNSGTCDSEVLYRHSAP